MAALGCPWPARRWFRILWVLAAISLLATLPVLIVHLSKDRANPRIQMLFVAGLFALLAVPVSIYEVAMHLEYFSRPKLQIRVIRILWMVPIYAVDCFFALYFPTAQTVLNPIRECYEAFVIYNFFMFLLAYLEDEYGDIDAYFSTKEDVPHIAPVSWCLRPWPNGVHFFWECKKGILNYVIVQPVLTLVGVITALPCVNRYKFHCLAEDQVDGHCLVPGSTWDGQHSYPYIVTINSVSASWALYCLILMFQGTKSELKPIRPLSKFLIVKAVVFATFWQSVALSMLTLVDASILPTLLPDTYGSSHSQETGWRGTDRAAWLQNWLICMEMFFAALAHAYAFPPKDYMDPSWQPKTGLVHGLKVMFDVRDVVDDVQGVVDETVQNTSDNVRQVGRGVRTAVTHPSTLLAMFRRQNSRQVPFREGDEFESDADESFRQRQLLPVPAQASRSDAPSYLQQQANGRRHAGYVAPQPASPDSKQQ